MHCPQCKKPYKYFGKSKMMEEPPEGYCNCKTKKGG
jgi:hypothetical protein